MLAVGPSLVGFSLYTLSLRYLQASVASLIATLEPALTAVMAIYFLSEQLLLWQWIGAALIEAFADHRIDEVHAAYTDFRSAFTTRATDRRFLPIAAEEVVRRELGLPYPEYIFEPEPSAILHELLPQYVMTKVYAALLESAASENAARRRAMKAATENAEDLIKVLTRVANQARQAEITTEIMDIVGGAEAMSEAVGE